jgi:hypothetical protein
MKIVFLGEFSGLCNALTRGLRMLGHESVVIADGDGFKGIPADISLPLESTLGLKSMFAFKRDLTSTLRSLGPIDVLNLVHPGVLGRATFLTLPSLRGLADKLLLWAAGGDVVHVARNHVLRLSPWRDYATGKSYCTPGQFAKRLLWDSLPLLCADGVIPVAYDYAEPYRHSFFKNKLLPTIPLAFNDDMLPKTPSRRPASGKIVVYHGITRSRDKGTPFIQAAFQDAALKVRNVDWVLGQKMPLKDYLKFLSGVDILVDQCNTHSYGMNAVIGMAMGCAVCTPCSVECHQEMAFPNDGCPLQNIEPDAVAIARTLTRLCSNVDALDTLKRQSREFAYSYHHPRRIASLYLERIAEIDQRRQRKRLGLVDQRVGKQA